MISAPPRGNLPQPPPEPETAALASFLQTCAEMGMTWLETASAVLRRDREAP